MVMYILNMKLDILEPEKVKTMVCPAVTVKVPLLLELPVTVPRLVPPTLIEPEIPPMPIIS